MEEQTKPRIPKKLSDPSHPACKDFNPDLLKPKDRIVHSAVNLNGHLLCAIDCETSGRKAGYHDIIQLAVLPLTPDLEPSRVFPPFIAFIKPKWPDRVDPELPPKMRQLFVDACTNGIEAWTCVDRFAEWFYKLKLPERKMIVPLGHNYSNFDKPFIQEWLGGPESYDEFFRSDSRDTMTSALFINDACNANGIRIPFPKYNMTYLCNILNIAHPGPHDAVADAFVTAKVYKKMFRYYDYWKTTGSFTLEAREIQAKEQALKEKQDGKA